MAKRTPKRDFSECEECLFESGRRADDAVVPGEFTPCRGGQIPHLIKIGAIVGHETKAPIGAQNSGGFGEKSGSDNPSALMPALRPRVRERDVQRGRAGVRQKILQCLLSLAAYGVCVFQAKPEEAFVAKFDTCGLFFDAQKIPFGKGGSHAGEKRPAVAAEIDFQRGRTGREPAMRNFRLHRY